MKGVKPDQQVQVMATGRRVDPRPCGGSNKGRGRPGGKWWGTKGGLKDREGLIAMMEMFRQRRLMVKIFLWVLVGMLAVGVLITTLPSLPFWGGQDKPPAPAQQPAADQSQGQSQLQQLQELVDRYRKMQAERPGNPGVLTGAARVETELGRTYLMQGKETQAREVLQAAAGHYRQALQKQDDTQLHLELAGVYQLLGSQKEAADQLQLVLQKEPRNLQARVQLGLLYEERQDWKQAAGIWQELSRESDPQTRQFAQERLRLLKNKLK